MLINILNPSNYRDLFESLLTPKPTKQMMGHNVEISQFADLLVLKDKELKVTASFLILDKFY